MASHVGDKQLPLALIATVFGVAVYALAVFWSSRHPSGLTLALAAFPFVWVAAVYGRGALRADLPLSSRLARPLPLIAIALVLWFAWEPLLGNVRLLYLTQHVGVHSALCVLFARTLKSDRIPLCTEFASWVHQDMSSPRLQWYTRQVTKAWAVFFALMVVTSMALFVCASPATWTAFSAVIGPTLTGLAFLLENLLRSYFLPPQDRVGLAGTWRAVRARIAHQAQSPQRAP